MGNLKSLPTPDLLVFLLLIPLHSANSYNVGDSVPLYVNKIGPLHNPSETYQYYELPFCRPGMVVEKKETLGEIFNGDRLANTLYELEFAVNKSYTVLCQRDLNKDDVGKFRNAIKDEFYYQMYYDDLPLWAFIGKIEDEHWIGDIKAPKYFMFAHVQFDVFYHGNQVIEVHAFSDPRHVVDMTEDANVKVEFTYSVIWNEIPAPFESRMYRYSAASLIPILRQTHWFAFINSAVIVILLIGLLIVLFIRHLKNDLRKWSIGDEDEEKEVGWKYIHGNVFRCPPNLPLFSALLGSGTQLLTVVFILFILAFLGILYPYSRGALYSFIFAAYIFTSGIASYRSASFDSQYSEMGWRRSALLAGIVFSGPFAFTTFTLNILAAYYGVTAALPFGTIFIIFVVFALVSVPLLVLGGVFGHQFKSELQSSPVTKKCPREIPSLVWYRRTPAQMLLGGLLPFSTIALELHNLCATMWGHKIYVLPGNLFITFIILAVVTVMLSVGLTYLQLAAEDHEWWWRSFLRGGATAIYMYGYCIYFYFKSNMSGILQMSFFFGYSACICYAFFLMLGTLSFKASLMFVRRVYNAVKSE